MARSGTARSARLDFKPLVYWFWHRLPLPGEIGEQLEAIREAGYGTVLIQPRLSFPREEYLGREYLEAYGAAMVRARELGLKAGLYDDYCWISGHAGGRTVRADDSLRECHLFWTTAEVRPGRAGLAVSDIRSKLVEGLGPAAGDWFYEGGDPCWSDWNLVTALAGVPAEDPARGSGPLLEVTGRGRIESSSAEGCRLVFESLTDLPAGARLTAFVSARCVNSRLINYLHPRAGETFVRAGYEPLGQALAGFFGDPLTFIFFDQPYSGFYDWQERSGNVLNSLMFDKGLAEAFEADHQAPLNRALWALAGPESAESPKLRCDFFETYGRLARRNFFGPVRSWARENGLALSGHELLGFVGGWGFAGGLPDLDSRVNFGADYFAIDDYKDISAVDACGYQAQLSARFGASLAKSHNRRGCLVEQYSVSPQGDAAAGRWDLTLAQLRSQSIRHIFQGASQVIFHGFYQTDGWDGDPAPLANPRHDFPPGINFEPWFGHHPAWARESEHLASFLAGAEEDVPVAVLYPLRTYWHHGPDHPFAAESAWWHAWLTENNYPFDIIDEDRLGDLRPNLGGEDGRRDDYQVLILPGVEIVSGSGFADRVERFVSDGGLVIASGPLPLGSQERGRDRELAERMAALFNGSAKAVVLPPLSAPDRRGELAAGLLAKAVRPRVWFRHSGKAAERLRTWAGRDDQGWRVALFNDGPEERRVGITVQGSDLIPRVRPLNGDQAKAWGWFDKTGSTTRAWADLLPDGLACFHFRPGEDGTETGPRLEKVSGPAVRGWAEQDPATGLRAGFAIHREGESVFEVVSAKEPTVTAPAAEWRVDSLGRECWAVRVAPGQLPEPVDLASDWTFAPQGVKEPRTLDVRFGWESLYPAYSGVGRYRTVFDLPSAGSNLEWDLELPRVVATAECFLNGSLIGERGWPPFTFPLPREILKKRDNRLRLEIANTAANRYGNGIPGRSDTAPASGLMGIPRLRPVVRVELAAN